MTSGGARADGWSAGGRRLERSLTTAGAQLDDGWSARARKHDARHDTVTAAWGGAGWPVAVAPLGESGPCRRAFLARHCPSRRRRGRLFGGGGGGATSPLGHGPPRPWIPPPRPWTARVVLAQPAGGVPGQRGPLAGRLRQGARLGAADERHDGLDGLQIKHGPANAGGGLGARRRCQRRAEGGAAGSRHLAHQRRPRAGEVAMGGGGEPLAAGGRRTGGAGGAEAGAAIGSGSAGPPSIWGWALACRAGPWPRPGPHFQWPGRPS